MKNVSKYILKLLINRSDITKIYITSDYKFVIDEIINYLKSLKNKN